MTNFEPDPETFSDEVFKATLKDLAGPGAIARPDQLAAARALVAHNKRVLVVQATGWGKSAVYWAATRALRELGRGPTLVVSPLLALMRDQLTAATRAGLKAATINSTNQDEWPSIMQSTLRGEVDLLLVSPERLANESFAATMAPVLSSVGLIVIDEAHCISDWGFDFRPDYQRLAQVLAASATAPVLATTATANERVTADVARQLGSDTLVLRGSLARTSLTLAVIPGLSPLERYAWVDEALESTPGSGIIYVPTVAETTRLAGFLTSRGHNVAAYSGQLDPAAREAVETRLKENSLKAVVATSALGMGYDKPDLGFCFHVGSPDSPVAYYQQVGRAGRALDHAIAVLLPAESDERLWEYFATASIPDPLHVDTLLGFLRSSGPATLAELEMSTGIRRSRLEALLRILAVDGAVTKQASSYAATTTEYHYDHVKWDELRALRAKEADLMRAFASGSGCLMQFLQIALDDPTPTSCGRCSVCTGTLPSPGTTPDAARVRAAAAFLRGERFLLEPRKRWPSGLTSGKKGAIVGPEIGRALCFADAPAWPEVPLLLTGKDAPVPDEILAGLIAVLADWKDSWTARPVAVTYVPSRRFPHLVRNLAERIAEVGRLPLLETLSVSGPRPPANVASGPRAEALLSTLSVLSGTKMPTGPVLLIDDSYATGWTMTVAAALLREAGASAVLPLVLHQRP